MATETGIRIKQARTAAGMSQAALAKAADCVTATEISKAERGIKELTPEQLEAVAKALGVTAESLLEPAPAAEETLIEAPVESAAEETQTEAPAILTAEERELLDLYRAADADKRQLALCILKGTSGSRDLEKIFYSLLKGMKPEEVIDIVKNMIMGSNVSDLIALGKSLMGSKYGKGLMSLLTGTGGSGSADASNGGGSTDESAMVCGGNQNRIEPPKSLMTFTYLYAVSIYILLLSFYFWLLRTDIKPQK